MEPIKTTVSVGQSYGKGLPNITLEDARFFGAPNFRGELNRFKDDRRQFTVMIPDGAVEVLQNIGYNVKTTVPTQEDIDNGLEPVHHLKVMVDDTSDVYVIMGEQTEKLITKETPEHKPTIGIIDKSRIEYMDMELRAWMYNEEEVRAGVEKPLYSARLVSLVATLRPNLLMAKYGSLMTNG